VLLEVNQLLEILKLAHLIHVDEFAEVIAKIECQRQSVGLITTALYIVMKKVPDGQTSFEKPCSGRDSANHSGPYV
jgi:hypothetical protein